MTTYAVAPVALALLIGGSSLWWGTDGLRAFTAEGVRRLAVERSPRPIPSVRMEDQRGESLGFDAFRGRWLLVEFIYTRCPTRCVSLGLSFQRIARELAPERLGRDVFLLSVSFDPEHDDRASLQEYAGRFRADGRGWRIARVEDRQELTQLLQAFGVVVIPDGLGGLEHNAAMHLVDREGRLTRIFDPDAVPQVAAYMTVAS